MTSVYATSEKSLKSILKKHSGRNNTGKITVRHQGGRHKRFYRTIDFVRSKRDEEAPVTTIAYDPNRTANIALVEYADGLKAYIIHCEGMKVGAHVISSETAEILPGNALPLKNIPLGTEVHNIELYPGKGGQIVKSAGSAAIVIAKEGEYVHIKLPSKEIRKILGQCYATIGRISNIEHKLKELGKAGKSRWRGIRPSVRGVAQAPNAHPHGGGEGRSGTGMHPKTKWGKPAMGKKTRKRKITNKFIISSRKQAR